MSGHSKWSQIKRSKGAKDAKRGILFSRLSKKISLATKDGGSGDPNLNFKLRTEIDSAKAQGLPNDNIDRAIKKGLGLDGSNMIEEVIYEGYGPFGTAFLIETATDNKNRTVNKIKHTLSNFGGNLGASGSVAWQFKTQGQILIERETQDLSQIELIAIDNGAEDVTESSEGLEIYSSIQTFEPIKKALIDAGIQITQAEIVKQSSQKVDLTEEQKIKVEQLFEELDENEDVIAVHTNANF